MVREFDLVPVHAAPLRRRLEAAPVRAVYRSRRTPSLVVVDKENGGKADALNVGLDVAGGELVCAIDSDTLVEADALQRMIRPFLVDDRVLAVGGTIRAVNGCAVRAGRVYIVDSPSYFSRPGPRTVNGLEMLAEIIHPELFSGLIPPWGGGEARLEPGDTDARPARVGTVLTVELARLMPGS